MKSATLSIIRGLWHICLALLLTIGLAMMMLWMIVVAAWEDDWTPS